MAKRKAAAKEKGLSLGTKGAEAEVVRVRAGVDRPMLIIIIILLCFGSVMVFSASYAYSLFKYDDSYFYIKKQIGFLFLGFAAMVPIMNLPMDLIRRLTVPFYIFSAILLAIVPVVGLAEGEAVRWINIGGFTIQPSEIMKPALVMVLALYIQNHQEQIVDYRHFWGSSKYGLVYPSFFVLVACALMVLENHFSGTIIMFAIGMIVIFAGGARLFWFGVAGGTFVTAVFGMIMFTDYAKQRVDIWLHPEIYNALDETWQTTQGLYAIGSGGWFGVGLGNSRQKHMFVSQPQNDFIYSIICEELGFIGALCVIALFVVFIVRGLHIARRAADTYSSLVILGIVGHVAVQAILNIAVVTNTIPNTGISLPFFSYGGSSLVALMAEMGVLLAL
ncbi:MAG: putative lipid II flippase FtsW, partial [Oscillospiraceae bacterium]|nr:putative lipid II flippase FtsW [Oscillospiraceae bacterium]